MLATEELMTFKKGTEHTGNGFWLFGEKGIIEHLSLLYRNLMVLLRVH